ncbi:MAG: hypothetical protein C4297_05325 [Gemmataceae bacterium]
MNAERLMFLGGLAAFVLTVYWVRSRDLKEKYALCWIAVASILLLCGLFPQTLMTLAQWLHLSYPAAVLFLALGIIYLFALGVSVSLTHYHRRQNRLMQQLALLEARVRELELAREKFQDTERARLDRASAEPIEAG